MTNTQGWKRVFDEKSGTSASEGGFMCDFSGCDDLCCGGCTVELNVEEIKAFIRAEKQKSYEEGAAAERERITNAVKSITLKIAQRYSDFLPKPEVIDFYDDAVEATKQAILNVLTPTDDITPKE